MDCMEALLTRTSVRKFKDDPVPDSLLDDLLRAAMAAPSARNLQPWEFITVTLRGTLDRLADIIPYGKMLHYAPLGIVVCGNTVRAMAEEGDRPLYWVLDCAAAVENLLLAAHASGLGAVWLGVFPRMERMQAIAELFRLPEAVIPHAVIAAGWPAEDPQPKNKFEPARIHREGWMGKPPAGLRTR